MSAWMPGITYRNLYADGVLGAYICPSREVADAHVSADNTQDGKRVAVIRITAKAR